MSSYVNPRTMTRIAALATMGTLAVSAQAADEFIVNNRTEVISNQVSGPGSGSSFLDPGTHVMHETDLRWRGTVASGQWNSLLNSTLRYTDSNQFDPERLSLQKLEWRLNDARYQINLGDYFANLSPYAMTKGIKGVAVQRTLSTDQNYVRAFYGSFDNEWAYLLKDLARAPMSTMGGGIRVQQAWEKFRLGFNLAEVHDQKDAAHATFPARSQVLPAVDWEYRESGLVVTGEHAYSDTDEVVTAGATAANKTGSAHKLVARASLKDINLDGHVERVTPDFMSLGGGATPDRMRYYMKADYKLNRDWRLFAVYDSYSDNLANQKPVTTDVTTRELGFKRAQAFGRRYMNVALSWRDKLNKTSDSSADRTTNRIKLKINDRVGDKYDWRAEVEQILDNDHIKSQDATSTLYDFGLSYRSRGNEKWEIRGDVDLGRQENGALGIAGTDVSQRLRLALNADRGNGTVFGASLERNAADLVAALADNRHLRASVYWQSKPTWLKDGSMKLEYADFVHSFTENALNDYRERVLKLTLVWNFQKEAKK
jgi:hypothetical protein